MESNNTDFMDDYSPKNNTSDLDFYSDEITLNTEIFFCIYIIIVPIGLMGNILSFCVLMRKEIRKTSTAIYLIALCITDTLCLLEAPMIDMILASELFLRWHWPVQNTLSCKFYNFLYFLNPHMSAWCLVSVTIERVIVIYFPHR